MIQIFWILEHSDWTGLLGTDLTLCEICHLICEGLAKQSLSDEVSLSSIVGLQQKTNAR